MSFLGIPCRYCKKTTPCNCNRIRSMLTNALGNREAHDLMEWILEVVDAKEEKQPALWYRQED